MKLFTRYNHILLTISVSGLLLIGFLFYKTMEYYLNQQIDEMLTEEFMEVLDYSHVKNILPAPDSFDDLVIQYEKINKSSDKKHFADTVFYNHKKQIKEAGRYLRAEANLNGQTYRVLIILSKVKRNEQIWSIVLSIILPVFLLLVILLLVNRILVKRLWRPFEQLLINIKAFNVNRGIPFKPVDTSVIEFRALNEAILEMSHKASSDYLEIKLFTENASHEMMTPLAMINSRLDTMLQSNTLKQEESETLTDLYKATSRLTRLNQSLLLLVKIDNNLLSDIEQVDIAQVIEEKLLYFQELIQSRDITVYKDLDSVRLFISRQLAEILINNLFSNAIRHNISGGMLKISLTSTTLNFQNTGNGIALDSEKIFERFYKDSSSEGTGLGLSILKQICNKYHFHLEYSFEKDMHSFKVTFIS